jgi:carbon starvation protein
MWIPLLPMFWLVTVTFTSALMKIWSPLPRIGFLAAAQGLERLPAQSDATRTLIFNNYLDAFVCALFLVLVSTILVDSARQWFGILRGTRSAASTETPFVQTTLAAGEI